MTEEQPMAAAIVLPRPFRNETLHDQIRIVPHATGHLVGRCVHVILAHGKHAPPSPGCSLLEPLEPAAHLLATRVANQESSELGFKSCSSKLGPPTVVQIRFDDHLSQVPRRVVDQELAETPFADIEDTAVKYTRIAFSETLVGVRHNRLVHVQQGNVGRDKVVRVAYHRDLETHRFPLANHELDEIPAVCDVVS